MNYITTKEVAAKWIIKTQLEQALSGEELWHVP